MLAAPAMTLTIAEPVNPSLIMTLNEPSAPVVPDAHDASASGAPFTIRQTRTLACFTIPFAATPLTVVGVAATVVLPPPPPPLHADSATRAAKDMPLTEISLEYSFTTFSWSESNNIADRRAGPVRA